MAIAEYRCWRRGALCASGPFMFRLCVCVGERKTESKKGSKNERKKERKKEFRKGKKESET